MNCSWLNAYCYSFMTKLSCTTVKPLLCTITNVNCMCNINPFNPKLIMQILPTISRRKWLSDAVRNDCSINFHLSKLSNLRWETERENWSWPLLGVKGLMPQVLQQIFGSVWEFVFSVTINIWKSPWLQCWNKGPFLVVAFILFTIFWISKNNIHCASLKGYSLQLGGSSEPSEQSSSRSHTHLLGIHCPLVHRNWVLLLQGLASVKQKINK